MNSGSRRIAVLVLSAAFALPATAVHAAPSVSQCIANCHTDFNNCWNQAWGIASTYDELFVLQAACHTTMPLCIGDCNDAFYAVSQILAHLNGALVRPDDGDDGSVAAAATEALSEASFSQSNGLADARNHFRRAVEATREALALGRGGGLTRAQRRELRAAARTGRQLIAGLTRVQTRPCFTGDALGLTEALPPADASSRLSELNGPVRATFELPSDGELAELLAQARSAWDAGDAAYSRGLGEALERLERHHAELDILVERGSLSPERAEVLREHLAEGMERIGSSSAIRACFDGELSDLRPRWRPRF